MMLGTFALVCVWAAVVVVEAVAAHAAVYAVMAAVEADERARVEAKAERARAEAEAWEARRAEAERARAAAAVTLVQLWTQKDLPLEILTTSPAFKEWPTSRACKVLTNIGYRQPKRKAAA